MGALCSAACNLCEAAGCPRTFLSGSRARQCKAMPTLASPGWSMGEWVLWAPGDAGVETQNSIAQGGWGRRLGAEPQSSSPGRCRVSSWDTVLCWGRCDWARVPPPALHCGRLGKCVVTLATTERGEPPVAAGVDVRWKQPRARSQGPVATAYPGSQSRGWVEGCSGCGSAPRGWATTAEPFSLSFPLHR